MADAQPHEGQALLVFADDWGRHASSCQHLIRQLLPRHTVYWVNTIGTRRPAFDLATLRRGMEKLRQWGQPAPAPAAGPTNPHVLNPRMWPLFSSRFDRWLNTRLLTRQLAAVLRDERRPVTALTTIPVVADLLGRLPVRRWVYYCVDDFSEWPGLDQRPLRQLEEALVAKADLLVAVSDTLQAKLKGLGRPAHLLTHGVDPEFWRCNGRLPSIPQLDGLPRPLIAFWGLVDRRMDTRFVRQLAGDLTQGTIVLAGPEADPDPALMQLPRVVRIPPLDFEQLPDLAREASVLVMPYDDRPVTRAMQPLKLKEYLVTGKPTVVRDLPATRPWADCLDLANSPEDFSQLVRERLTTGLPEAQVRARERLREETWAEKAALLEHWVFGD